MNDSLPYSIIRILIPLAMSGLALYPIIKVIKEIIYTKQGKTEKIDKENEQNFILLIFSPPLFFIMLMTYYYIFYQ